jgi:uncharacterized protein DUF4760
MKLMAVADRLGELRFPVTASIVSTLIVTFLGAVYWYATARIPDTVLFVAAAATGAGTVLGAFYTARGLELTASVLARDEIRYKTSLAFGFTSKWNDPAMFDVRDAVRELLNGDHNSVEFAEHLVCHETNVIHFMNFLEELSIAIERGGADPHVLREAFRGIALTAWSKLQAWVVEQRRRRNAPRLWINVEGLARNWN